MGGVGDMGGNGLDGGALGGLGERKPLAIRVGVIASGTLCRDCNSSLWL